MARKKNGQGDSQLPGPAGDAPLLEATAPAPIAEPVLSSDPAFDLVLGDAAPAPGPPVAPVVVPASLAPLEDRIRHLEEAIGRLQPLEGLEQRLSDRLTGLQREPPVPQPPALQAPAPNVLDAARAIVSAGRTLLPGLDAAPSAAGPQFGAASTGSLLRDALAELQAMYYMYVDPRYRLSWAGRGIPIALVVMFVFSGYWLKFATCGLVDVPLLGWLLNKAVDLLIGYAVFKALSHEAHRYRETAPDLPSHLRR